MKRIVWVFAALVAVGVVTLKIREALQPSLHFSACFQTESGLKPGAEVRVAGVAAGIVQSVSLHNKDCPLRVEFKLVLTRDFRSLPRNATARMETAGILGPTFLEIDLPAVPGPPLENRGTVKTVENNGHLDPKAAEKLKKVIDDAIDRATQKRPDAASGDADRARQ